MAWSGLLSDFAGGVFLVILQPFKVGDFVTAAGVTGTVEEIGLFATTLDTPDNREDIGNGKIFADTIQNFSANPYRRVELMAQLAHGCGPANGDCAAETSTGTSAERAGRAGTRCRDPDIQPFGRAAYSSPVLRQQALLASVFRHEPADPIRLRMPDSQFPSSTTPCGGPEDIRLAKTAEAGLFLTCTV